jgi:hypothetical protein
VSPPGGSFGIYPYIPFAGALVWNRVREDEAPVKVHVSFSPDWFAARMGLDLGERWHRDPVHRRESFVAMARALNSEFPRLRLGGDPSVIRGGLSQAYSCAPVAALFGQAPRYSAAGWPENERIQLDDEAAEALVVPDVGAHPLLADIMRQCDIIEREWGPVEGELNYQGVLNTAFRLRGESIFTDMVTAPARARRVLEVVTRTTMAFVDAVYARQRASGAARDYFVTSNCVVNMISDEHYRAFVQPFDRMLSDHWPHFGIHNCGWTVDAYAEGYAEIREIEYLDFGIRSDLPRLRALFPRAVLTLILNPDDVLAKSRAQLRVMLEPVRAALGSCRLIVGSLDTRTPVSLVEDFFDAVAETWECPAEQLVPRAHFG